MSAHDAVDALRDLGLSNYEARVFVALQRLGDGTAQDVAAVADVPRSQVYGAADDLADRGLLEVVESSPKTYRPVSLERARAQLRERIDRQQARAFDNLEAVAGDHGDRTDAGDVATLRGHGPIRDRAVDLVERADDQVVLVGAGAATMRDDLAAALDERAAAGIDVTVVTADSALADRLSDARVIVSEASADEGYAGRTLLVDDATVLLSVPTDDGHEPFDEVAMWTAGTRIGHILARFVHAGMESGLDDGALDGR
ncbi:TrmB family transcriptional regulator [Halobacterium jilantaiense]|uniref:Sugar-specific transcriptional regulator TrmB n=1 Tax=Halobacterium jilantaiense TaxID=355548 RepID=A0A1I0N427_9EURY|nr:helix-turn-helix domain-containing protein [Halobacterium jilantaiense]SEV95788.1 Sugar-specific transcriptional regulator TrmB [Halobacterium jilantaiense]